MKILKWVGIIVLLMGVIYFFGPKVEVPQLNKELPELPTDLRTLENLISEQETLVKTKPDNEARIIWYDSTYQKTPYSIVYLHGFSASQAEGAPLHSEIAQRYGCNLFLARLYGHGIFEEEPMLDLTAEKLVNSAKEAIAVGKRIGEKVIVIATSTGGTMALYLVGKDPDITGLILYSPNVEIYDPNSWVLDKPWGLQVARLVKGGKYNAWEPDPKTSPYWTNGYRLEAVTHLRALIEATMTQETFESVDVPVFLGYFYKNDSIQDNTVSVPAMLDMYVQLGTPDSLKREMSFPDANHHVISSYLTSKDLASVRSETFRFIDEILHLVPVVRDTVPQFGE